MFRVNLFYFLVGLTLAVCATDFEVYEGVKRSAVCLIERIATHNHIAAKFEKVSQVQKNGTTHIGCKLDLGTENYRSNSTSLAKAKEKVSREAYALTKYGKPPLHNRTCIVHGPINKNDISVLEEYGHIVKEHILYSEEGRNSNGTFEYTASLSGKSGSGFGYRKKTAKAAAATNLLEAIGRLKVIDTLIAKYNRTQFHSMEPTLRLSKIARVTGINSDAIYTKENEVTESEAGKGQGKRITVQVNANDYMASGSGATFEKAKTNAAANLLRSMNFAVTYKLESQ